jgi:hypothetical protein
MRRRKARSLFTGGRRRVAIGGAIATLALGLLATHAAPPGLERRTKITADLRILTADPVERADNGPTRLVLDSPDAAETRLRLAWPEPGEVSELGFRVSHAPPTAGAERAVKLDARLVLPDRTTVNASRTVAFDDRVTTLFEVHRFDERSLTLAVELAADHEWVVSKGPTPGSTVQFRMEIVRVLDGRPISLENDYLNTLIGEDVSYAFRLSETPDADAVTVTLEPTRLIGEILQIEIGVSGRLPVGDELMVIGRSERWMATRDATTTLAFEAGDPPTGYRFLITARY